MKQCEYCRRGNSFEAFQCAGCGAPFKPVGIYGDGSGVQAVIYDPRVFDSEAVQFLGRPVTAIPINLAALRRVEPSIRFQSFRTDKFARTIK